MNATIILPDLAIGSYTALAEMKSQGWVCLCLVDEGANTPYDLLVPMIDAGGNRIEKIKQSIDWILDTWNNKQKVFVCCVHGMNRSVSIGAAALTLAGRTEWFSNALMFIQSKRNVATPRDDTMVEILAIVGKRKNLHIEL